MGLAASRFWMVTETGSFTEPAWKVCAGPPAMVGLGSGGTPVLVWNKRVEPVVATLTCVDEYAIDPPVAARRGCYSLAPSAGLMPFQLAPKRAALRRSIFSARRRASSSRSALS